MIVAFRPFRMTKTFRFWKAFKDYKHGHAESLEEVERQLMSFLSGNGDHSRI
jgi:hypothetical protein